MDVGAETEGEVGLIGLLRRGVERSAVWMHVTAAICAFTSDFLKPVLPHCTIWVIAIALAAFVLLWFSIRQKWLSKELGTAAILFALVTAVLSAGVLVLQKASGDPPEGEFAQLVPALKRLQDSLDILTPKINRLTKDIEQNTPAVEENTEATRELLASNNEFRRDIQKQIQSISHEKGVPVETLEIILKRLGETSAAGDVDKIEAALQQKADEYVSLKQQLTHLTAEDPRARALQQKAKAAFAKSDFDGARSELRQAADIESATIADLMKLAKDRAKDAADSLSQSGDISKVALQYRAAADDYGRGADVIAPFDLHASLSLRGSQGDALLQQGNQFGDNKALEGAIDVYGRALAAFDPNRDPYNWAAAENDLANALLARGQRSGNVKQLADAVDAYKKALTKFSRTRDPEEWASAESNLANALQSEGDIEGSPDILSQSVATMREALKGDMRKRNPERWALFESNLGSDLLGLALLQSNGTQTLKDAADAFNDALKVLNRTKNPFEWATVECGEGSALANIGIKTSSDKDVSEGIADERTALTVATRARYPVLWGKGEDTLAMALVAFGLAHGDHKMVQEGIDDYTSSAQVATREADPIQWTQIEADIGGAYFNLAGISPDEEAIPDLANSIAATKVAIEALRSSQTQYYMAVSPAVLQGDLQQAEAELKSRQDHLKQSTHH